MRGPSPHQEKEEELSFGEVVRKASASAVRGGTAGAVAMGANVFALMWMRTTVRFSWPLAVLRWFVCSRPSLDSSSSFHLRRGSGSSDFTERRESILTL
jgi:hypothetical protein